MNVPSGSQAVERAARLLVCLVEDDRALTVGELASATGLHQATTSRLVAALERHGIVARDGKRGRVRPGPVLLRLAVSDFSHRRLVELAAPILDEIGDRTRETVNLSTPMRDGVNHLAQVDSDYLVGTTNWVGRAVPLHCSSTGKVFLAFGSAELPKGALDRLTKHTITDRQALTRDLEIARRRGFALTVDELEVGLSAVAAPVRDRSGVVVAALSVSGPSMRLRRELLQSHGRLLHEAAGRLSDRIEQAIEARAEDAG
jgi:IclR family acetate operon transcriptional repressor